LSNRMETEALVERYGKILNDPNARLSSRFRALFSLKNLASESENAIIEMGKSFTDSSELLKHELAYCLGQTKNEKALEILRSVLNDGNQEPVVRHEAAEAIGAIAPADLEQYLKKLMESDKDIEVRETAHLAYERIKFHKEHSDDTQLWENEFGSVDPAPPSKETDFESLKKLLMDKDRTLFDRYRAMFSLRNLVKTDKRAIDALLTGFDDKDSALFRHEVAFVFGQIGEDAVAAEEKLIAVVEDENEHGMVRHEAAEALGSISTEKSLEFLKRFSTSPCRIVRESCEVAIDQAEYYSDQSQFQPLTVA